MNFKNYIDHFFTKEQQSNKREFEQNLLNKNIDVDDRDFLDYW